MPFLPFLSDVVLLHFCYIVIFEGGGGTLSFMIELSERITSLLFECQSTTRRECLCLPISAAGRCGSSQDPLRADFRGRGDSRKYGKCPCPVSDFRGRGDSRKYGKCPCPVSIISPAFSKSLIEGVRILFTRLKKLESSL